MTPIREAPRRMSFSPPKLPFSNRTLITGTVLFLFLSAVYKSGIIGWVVRMKVAELQGNISLGTLSSADTVPGLLYESTLAEVDQLYARVIFLESFQSQFNQQCLLRDRVHEQEIQECTGQLTGCHRSLDKISTTLDKAVTGCQNSIVQLEVEQIQVIEKIESDYERRLSNLLDAKNSQLQDLEERLVSLGNENGALRERFDSHKQEPQELQFDIPEPPPHEEIQKVSIVQLEAQAHEVLQEEDIVADFGIGMVDEIENSNFSYQIAITILSSLVIILGTVSGVLWVSRESEEIIFTSPVPTAVPTPALLDTTAIEERDSSEEERMFMALEDVAAKIAREVRCQLEMIEAHHDREMSLMRAIVEETHRTSAEIGSLVKEVIDETSIESTCNNSPCMSPSGDSCSIESLTPADASSLSVLLETSVTPIRVPVRDRVPVAKTSSSIPTCYSIASPSRRSRQRRMKRAGGAIESDSSSGGEERLSVEDDDSMEKENFAKDMVNIWDNFKD